MLDSTKMSGDPFSDILTLTRAEAIVTGGFTGGGDWAIRFPPPDTIKFFAVIAGHCWLLLDGQPEPARVETGDVCLLSARRSYVLASDVDVVPVDAMPLFSGAGRTTAVLGDGSSFTHIGGHVLLDPLSGQLLRDCLPPWLHLQAASPRAPVFRWLLDQLVDERANALPGTQVASAHLAQLLFVQIVRAHLETTGAMPAGWMRALADPRIAPSLRLMHAAPFRAWHLDELAQACGMSRTSFANHFRTTVGVPPLTYLVEWRMHLAQRRLREETKPISEIARALGYASDSAFSSAFKRMSGKSPRAFREERNTSQPGDVSATDDRTSLNETRHSAGPVSTSPRPGSGYRP